LIANSEGAKGITEDRINFVVDEMFSLMENAENDAEDG